LFLWSSPKAIKFYKDLGFDYVSKDNKKMEKVL
jgi:hypothetical protein